MCFLSTLKALTKVAKNMASKAMCMGLGIALLALMGFQVVQLDLLKHIDIGIPADWHCEAAFQDQVEGYLHSGGIL